MVINKSGLVLTNPLRRGSIVCRANLGFPGPLGKSVWCFAARAGADDGRDGLSTSVYQLCRLAASDCPRLVHEGRFVGLSKWDCGWELKGSHESAVI